MLKYRNLAAATTLALPLAATALSSQVLPGLDAGRTRGVLAEVHDAMPLSGPDLHEVLRSVKLAELSGLAQLSSLANLAHLAELSALAPLGELSQLGESLAPLGKLGQLTQGLGPVAGLDGAARRGGFHSQGTPLPPAPDPHATGDQVDSLYRLARTALNRGDFRRAADLFQEISRQHPKSSFAADALYWRAFALQRLGRSEDLRTALESLDRQRAEYPEAATKGDAAALAARIRGELAQRGDADAAARVAEDARSAAVPPVLPTPPTPPVPVRSPRPPREPRPLRADQAPRGQLAQSQCPAEDDDERVAALNALLQMDADRALPILKRVLARRDDCSATLRRKAVFMVAQHETSETADVLLDVARNDPDVEVRRQAVFWLGQVDGERAVEILDSLLRTSSDDEIREKALFALSQHDSQRSGQVLRDFAERGSAPEGLREKAIFWLGQQDRAANAEFLRGLYGRLTSETLKEKVLFSLSQMGGQGNERWLLDVAVDNGESIEMRKKALFWAGQSDLAASELVGLYDRMTHREMKEQLIFVYSQRDDAGAIDKLLDVARREPDRELRKKAIFWLSQSDDPRVAKFLEEILNR